MRKAVFWRRAKIGSAIAGVCVALALGAALSSGYLAQAARGQARLTLSARSVEEMMADPGVDLALKAKLARAQKIRAFAVSALGLPDNGSYKSYADVGRPFALWNVVAAPRLSLSPKQWCFPIAGCVSYRGYYAKKDAEREAQSLKEQGYDAEVGGVAAYSTLGWLNDPLISTFINRPEAELAGLMFHELAHQTVYAPGDSAFNESFATAVERAGVELWLERNGSAAQKEQSAKRLERDGQFLALLTARRKALSALYESGAPEEAKIQGKREQISALKADYAALRERWGGYSGYDRWFSQEPSNAGLAVVATYNDGVPAFREMMMASSSMPVFYAEAKRLAGLSKDQRSAQLLAWSARAQRRALEPGLAAR